MNYAHVDLPTSFGKYVWLALLTLILSTVLPGFVISSYLLKSSNPSIKIASSPMIGLFCLFVIAGTVQVIGFYSPTFLVILVLGMNLISLLLFKQLGQDIGSILKDVYSTHFSESPNRVFSYFFLLVSFLLLSPIFILDIPYGVDWIGFSNILVALNQSGTMRFTEPNLGAWIYPPGFISAAGLLSIFPTIDEFQALMILGFYSLFAIVLGVFAVGEKYKAGIYCGLMMFLGVGLFAKSFDSGWPTIASQIPVLVGLLILQETDFAVEIGNRVKLLFTILGALIIHPTGAISLLILIFVVLFIQTNKVSKRENRVAFIGIILLFIAASTLLSSNLSNLEQFSEYGWQGGMILIKFNAPLCLIALYFMISHRDNPRIKILSNWLTITWIFSFLHLLPILEELSAFKLLGYICYSMGLHMFHIPFALVSGIGLMLGLQSIQENEESENDFNHYNSKQAITLLLVCCLLLPIGMYALIQTEENKHHFATTSSTLELIDEVNSMEINSVVYTENSHWGYLQIEELNFQTTSIPRLGLMIEDSYVQSEATRAILSNDFQTLGVLGIEYAITSPMGSLHYSLIESNNWDVVIDIDGSRLWKLDANISNTSIQAFALDELNCGQKDCTKVKDLWRDYRYNDQLQLGDNRAKLSHEATIRIPVDFVNQSGKACLLYEVRGNVDEFNLRFSSNNKSIDTTFDTSPGWHLDCAENISSGSIEIEFDVQISNNIGFVNPSGFSGRAEYLLEKPGIVLHHFEFHGQS
ncbi:MAG: hypothetical protein ACPGAN_02940 [Candidatus Poseidoniaceae archaeon]